MVKFYEDISAERARIEGAIERYGYSAEHHFEWYQYCKDKADKNIFVETEHGALLTVQAKQGLEYYVFCGPLAPLKDRAGVLVEYIDHIFKTTSARKVWLELDTPLRRDFLSMLPTHLKASAINYSLIWPITNLFEFDPELAGGAHKAMRKEKHKFYRDHQVIVRDAKTYDDLRELKGIIDRWIVQRPTSDKVWAARYYNLIKNHFAGMAEARIFMVDDKPVGINAGWMIPNSDCFYGAVGIHDYSFDDLGLVLYWEDLAWLKGRGYRVVDMGGTWGTSLNFKNKFSPHSSYKTYIFSVVKKL